MTTTAVLTTAGRGRKGADPRLTPTGRPQRRTARMLVLPALIVSIVLTQIPFLVTIVVSFLNWNQLRPDDTGFAWFDNYATVFATADFAQSLLATVLITGSSVALALLLGLGFALLMDRHFLGQGLARTLMITPFLVMPAAASLIWKFLMLDVNVGLVNVGLGFLGLPPVAWNTDLPPATIIIVMTWQFTPFMMLILLAGLQSQDRSVLEAASVDGAGRIRIFRDMTLPHLRQYIEIAVLLGGIMLLQMFDPIAIMTKGTGGTKTLPYLLYERAFIGLDIGQAAAFGVMTVAITLLFAGIALRTLFGVFVEGKVRS
ncbi:carbohydrate ABC transporter permease [Microbacterium karelineae]|uniref:carbohydrate ABC transporter permease n=1 Tax=Microbacterium karelineae TaxID=2654283 RepID=UPI0012EA8003|nr:sugar ABC transporter permease [Microbacterium karelineae]